MDIILDIHGYTWICMDIHGYSWILTDFNGYIHGYERIFVDIHERKCKSTEHMDINGCSWI